MLRQFAYRAPYLSGWNQRSLREMDSETDGLFDKNIRDVAQTLGIHFSEERKYRNIYKFSKFEEALKQFGSEPDQADVKLGRGSRLAKRKFAYTGQNKLTALRLDDKNLYDLAQIRGDKSAGLTNFGKTKEEAWTDGLRYAILILRGKAPHPAIAYTRTQKNEKTRLVWGYPLEMTILESLIARPLIDYYLRVSSPMMFGKTSTFMGAKFREASAATQYITSVDYSQFDSHVQRNDIQFSFNVLKTFFDLEQKVFEDFTVADVFKVVERFFINTPLVFPNEKGPSLVLGKRLGVPSGSYFTQMVDSIVNYALAADIFYEMDLKFNPDYIWVLGDDMIAFTYGKVDLAKFEYLATQRGYIANKEKGGQTLTVNAEFEFLGRRWRNFLPRRTIQEVMDRALYPERWRQYDSNPYQEAHQLITSYTLTSIIDDCHIDRGVIPTIQTKWLSGYLRELTTEKLIRGKKVVASLY